MLGPPDATNEILLQFVQEELIARRRLDVPGSRHAGIE
jgi:hypothetical protein